MTMSIESDRSKQEGSESYFRGVTILKGLSWTVPIRKDPDSVFVESLDDDWNSIY